MTEEPVKLSIIVVNWNSTEFLIECLDSLLRKPIPVSSEIIVVDNASTDGSASSLDQYPGIELIRNSVNAGFAKANNQAIKGARGEYILLLNPDTLIEDNCILEEWVRYMDEHPETGVSGCRLVYPDGSYQVGDAGFRPTFMSVFNYAFFLSKIHPSLCKGLYLAEGKTDGEMEVDWVCGADLLLRRSILPGTGLLDETVFMYAEDVEFGCRIRSAGHKVCYLPSLRITHLQGASLKKASAPETVSLTWLENTRRLYRLFNKGQPVFFYDLLMTCAFLLRTVIYSMKYLLSRNREQGKKAARMWAYCRGSARHLVRKPPRAPGHPRLVVI